MKVALRLEGILKTYRAGVRALDGVDLEVDEGEMVVLVGPSGCGKTTLLRLIAGLEDPTAGRIILHDLDVTHTPPGKRDIAMVFQNYSLYPFKTVYENLAFGLRMRSIPRAEIDNSVQETAARLGLDSLLDRYPDELSGGQQQRVALGRAIVRKPRLFLFDEPLSSLDANLRRGMRQEIKRLQRESATAAVYVTHDQEEAMSLGDRLVIMREGRLLQVATPKKIYSKPATRFVAEFFGSPPMNFLKASVYTDCNTADLFLIACDHRHTISAHLKVVLKELVGQAILIGFRPESLAIRSDSVPALSIRLKVTLLEDLGEHIDASFTTMDGRAVMGRLPADCSLHEGDYCDAQVPLEECFFFREDGDEIRVV